jgi:hypothetical protein
MALHDASSCVRQSGVRVAQKIYPWHRLVCGSLTFPVGERDRDRDRNRTQTLSLLLTQPRSPFAQGAPRYREIFPAPMRTRHIPVKRVFHPVRAVWCHLLHCSAVSLSGEGRASMPINATGGSGELVTSVPRPDRASAPVPQLRPSGPPLATQRRTCSVVIIGKLESL